MIEIIAVLFQICVEFGVNGNISFMGVVSTLLCVRDIDVVVARAHIRFAVVRNGVHGAVHVDVDVDVGACRRCLRLRRLPLPPPQASVPPLPQARGCLPPVPLPWVSVPPLLRRRAVVIPAQLGFRRACLLPVPATLPPGYGCCPVPARV